MNNAKAKLTPVKGLVLLGLTAGAVAYATPCFYETSSDCAYTGEVVGEYNGVNIFADGSWEFPDVTTTPPGLPSGQAWNYFECYGPAYYILNGVRNNLSSYTNADGSVEYKLVNTNSACH